MNRLQPFQEIDSFTQIARDFNTHLRRDDNADIQQQFPGTVKRYASGEDMAIENLESVLEYVELGKHEQFIVYFGEIAAGLCVVSNQTKCPPNVDPSWPNLSGFIMNPFRGIGLGRFSIEQRMGVVKEDFGDRAWTLVKDGNERSEHLVLDVGFRKTDQEVEGWEGHHLFLYEGGGRSA